MGSELKIPDIIANKRDGQEHSEEEIITLVNAIISGTAQPAQIGAWLMASYLNGLTDQEIMFLTREMRDSGDVLEWPSEWSNLLVDKHSTGGVGDKVSLILAPALAACGMKVPMISGRGLAHTGGTLDKLESIPGYQVSLEKERVQEILTSVGCCIVGQTKSLVPADRILYAARDVTATVREIGLITASIISKKAAEGIGVLVLDVKHGNGAFMENLDMSEKLAKSMVTVGSKLGIKTAAILSDMNDPLGRAVGNALEVAECVRCLQGEGPDDLMDLTLQTGGLTLYLAGRASSKEHGYQLLQDVINNRQALEKFKAMIIAHGVAEDLANQLCSSKNPYEVISRANTTELKCPKAGRVKQVIALPVAKAAHLLGAGRNQEGETINHAVGVELLVSAGDLVQEGTRWARVYYNGPEILPAARNFLEAALVIDEVTASKNRVTKIILSCKE